MLHIAALNSTNKHLWPHIGWILLYINVTTSNFSSDNLLNISLYISVIKAVIFIIVYELHYYFNQWEYV